MDEALNIKQVAVVIPVYKSTLNDLEIISIKQLIKILPQYPIILVGPKNLDITNYLKLLPSQSIHYITFSPHHFSSVKNYSLLMTLPKFYKQFLKYKYILIYQLDSYVFSDQLLLWCEKSYDYVGAPWIDAYWLKKLSQKYSSQLVKFMSRDVGNGGFSLRKTKTFYYSSIVLLPFAYLWPRAWNEDSFWANFASRIIPFFKIPSSKVALQFAFEENPDKCFKINNHQLPFGCHAWEKYNPKFWSQYIQF